MSVETTDIKLRQYFDSEMDRIMNRFQRIGELFIDEARLNGSYRDRTGNLRSSIGYSIGFNGDSVAGNVAPLVRKGHKGHSSAEQYGQQLIRSEGNGANLIIVGFAGMEYGKDVEARKKDVITESTKRAMRRLKAVVEKGWLQG